MLGFLAKYGLAFFAVCTAFLPFAEAVRAQEDAVIDRVRGRIVLNVEGAGEAWYISPLDDLRYSLGRPEEAYTLMRRFGLGISDENLALIPRAGMAGSGDMALRQRLAGRILLQVQSHGEAWYVEPVTLRRYYLGRPQDAFDVMRGTGLGVTREDLAHISAGTVISTVIDDVPFYAQAPLGRWSDPRQQEGCEEASVMMAVDWAENRTRTPQQAEAAIIAMSEFERANFGAFVDSSTLDTFDWLMIEHHEFFGGEYVEGIDALDVMQALSEGMIVVLPVNGTVLDNPYFQGGGPLRHMIVVYGYDYVTGEFLTHEPGTIRGDGYRYSFHTLDLAINDYNSGTYEPLPVPPRTAMILVSRS